MIYEIRFYNGILLEYTVLSLMPLFDSCSIVV